MKYRIVARAEDETGVTTEVDLIPAVDSQPGWRCHHAIWPAWMKDEQTTECGWCREPLVPCEYVECPWCEQYVTTDEILAHWQRWCEEEPQEVEPDFEFIDDDTDDPEFKAIAFIARGTN